MSGKPTADSSRVSGVALALRNALTRACRFCWCRTSPAAVSSRSWFAAGFLVQPKDPADFQRVYGLLESDATWRTIRRHGKVMKSTRPYRPYSAKVLRDVFVRSHQDPRYSGHGLVRRGTRSGWRSARAVWYQVG